MAELRTLSDAALRGHALIALREAIKQLVDAETDLALGTVLRSTVDRAVQNAQEAQQAVHELRRRTGATTKLRASMAEDRESLPPPPEGRKKGS